MSDFIVGIRFKKVSKVYHFSANQYPELEVGDFVVVQTSRGLQLGEVAQLVADPPNPEDGSWKPVMRKATPRDLVVRQLWEEKEEAAIEFCRDQVAKSKLSGVKIVSAEYTLDGERLTFSYTCDDNEQVDLTKLRKAAQKKFRVRIGMRRIGPRDAAKIIGGMGACGMATRCCTLFMAEFCPISIKMAKSQGVSLAPTEITGMCGRLRCCLQHEHEFYAEARKHLPKNKKQVSTPMGDGKVIKVNPLNNTVLVDLGERGRKEFPNEEVQLKHKS